MVKNESTSLQSSSFDLLLSFWSLPLNLFFSLITSQTFQPFSLIYTQFRTLVASLPGCLQPSRWMIWDFLWWQIRSYFEFRQNVRVTHNPTDMILSRSRKSMSGSAAFWPWVEYSWRAEKIIPATTSPCWTWLCCTRITRDESWRRRLYIFSFCSIRDSCR